MNLNELIKKDFNIGLQTSSQIFKRKSAASFHENKLSDFYLNDYNKKGNNFKDKKSTTFHENLKSQRNDEKFIPEEFFSRLTYSLQKFCEKHHLFLDLCRDLDKITYCSKNLEERIKCYRPELGETLSKIFKNYNNLLMKSIDHTYKLQLRKKNKIKHLKESYSKIVEQIRIEKDALEKKNLQMKEFTHLQESEFKINKLTCDSLQNEVLLLHDLLKKNISNSIAHLSDVEKLNSRGKNNFSERTLNSELKNMEEIIKEIEDEHSNKSNLLNSMNNLLKSMIKEKTEASTQVEEGDLKWSVKDLGSAVEVDFIKDDKGRKIQDIFLDEKRLNENTWSLPPLISIFLMNTLELKDKGNVLPWLYCKKILFDIYVDRVQTSSEMNIYGIYNSSNVPFEEYLLLYFLKIYQHRRLAEQKLLELLISLRYYQPKWPRAELFCNLSKLSPIAKIKKESNFATSVDIYAENYFFFIFKTLYNPNDMIENENGNTYIKIEKVENKLEYLLHFLEKEEFIKAKKRILVGEHQEGKVQNFDKTLDRLVIEFWRARKERFRNLIKQFSKICEKENGILVFDDFKQIFKPFENFPTRNNYCFLNEFIKLRAFFDSLTISHNKMKILNKDFLKIIKKYGLDCPLYSCFEKKAEQNDNSSEVKIPTKIVFDNKSKTVKDKNKTVFIKPKEKYKWEELSSLENTERLEEKNRNVEKIINNSSTNQIENLTNSYFAQNFSIMRELKAYCDEFKQILDHEKDINILNKHFLNIASIIEMGCMFTNFPVIF